MFDRATEASLIKCRALETFHFMMRIGETHLEVWPHLVTGLLLLPLFTVFGDGGGG